MLPTNFGAYSAINFTTLVLLHPSVLIELPAFLQHCCKGFHSLSLLLAQAKFYFLPTFLGDQESTSKLLTSFNNEDIR